MSFQHPRTTQSITNELQPELWKYMVGTCRHYDVTVMAVDGMEDHGHILFTCPHR